MWIAAKSAASVALARNQDFVGDCSRKETLPERAERDNADTEFLQRRKDFPFRVSPP